MVRLFARTPRLREQDGAVRAPIDLPQIVRDSAARRISYRYPWGVIECAYENRDDQLRIALQVTNGSDATMEALELRIMDLTFKSIPSGRILDAGMFAMAGTWQPLHKAPHKATPREMPPVIFVDFHDGMLAFAIEGDAAAPDIATPSIPFTADALTKLTYPLTVSLAPIAPHATSKVKLSVRFGLPGSDGAIASDILRAYEKSFPYVLDWPDRRPIGALFLATSETHPVSNPRGWFQNAKDVDTTTPEGLAKWRERLMRYADDVIRVLRDTGAQGMITWDPEGEEFRQAAYYGDPRLAGRLAPETEIPGPTGMGALDEYFQKIRDAGFRVGVTVRPQRITFKDGIPAHGYVDDPAGELLDKIEYARSRWRCTVFYVDSTYDKNGALTADVFRTIHRKHPDILLLPENETLRDYAYSAPLNSFTHHGVTGTPPGVLDVYPKAFSVLLMTTSEQTLNAAHDALLKSVRHGDILLMNAWFSGKHTDFVKNLYREAAPGN